MASPEQTEAPEKAKNLGSLAMIFRLAANYPWQMALAALNFEAANSTFPSGHGPVPIYDWSGSAWVKNTRT